MLFYAQTDSYVLNRIFRLLFLSHLMTYMGDKVQYNPNFSFVRDSSILGALGADNLMIIRRCEQPISQIMSKIKKISKIAIDKNLCR